MRIDSNKKPEGATHYMRIADSDYWYRVYDGVWDYWSGMCWVAVKQPSHPVHALDLEHKPWTGSSLPPVGTKVTIETNGLRIWKEAEVFIGRTSEVVATFKLIESDMVVVYLEEENTCCVFRASMCRLPKTAEQIKDEADACATSVLTGELEHLVLVSERLGPSELAEKLIRLNYRKQTDQ